MAIVDDSGLEVIRKAADVISPTVYRLRTSGTATFTGLSTTGRVTEVQLNSVTWTALPATALTARNAISIQNPTGTGVEIKINYSASIVGYVGMAINSGGERQYDITDAIPVFAKSASGTPTVYVEELA